MTKAKRISMKAIRKEEILKAALIVLSERGSANVTLDDIAKAAGFSKGGVTYYYSSKEALIKDVFEYFFEHVWERVRNDVHNNKSQLDKFLAFSWLYNPDDEQSQLIYPLLFDILTLATFNDDYRESFRVWVHKWVDIAEEMIIEGKKAGVFKAENTRETAQLISAIAQGIGIRWYLDREHHTTEWAVKAYAETIYKILQVQESPMKQRPVA